MLNNNRVQRYNKKMTLKREKTKKSQMPEGRWDFYINMLYSAKKYRTKKSVRLLSQNRPRHSLMKRLAKQMQHVVIHTISLRGLYMQIKKKTALR